jgi:peptidoglycan/LPS O-acetylase OafA/YrhL
MRHYNNFDLLRILAALQVAIVHVAGFRLATIFPGVPVFFVISGFLVSESFENAPLQTYFLNRALRILPGLWMCIAVSIVIVSLNVPIDWGQFWPWLLAQMTVAQSYNPPFLSTFGTGVLNGSLWTIPVEMQFYLLVPVLYRFRLNLPVMIGIGILMYWVFLYWIGHGTLFTMVSLTSLPYVYMFLVGVFLQRNRPLVQKYLVGHWPWWLAGYLIIELVTRQLGLYIAGNYLNPFSAITLACLVISLAHTKPVRIRYDLSYGVYLYHTPILNLFIAHGRSTGFGVVEIMGVTVALAWLSSVLIERPALRLKRRIGRPEPPLMTA